MATLEETQQSIAQLMEAMGKPDMALPPPPKRAPAKPLKDMSCLDLGSLVGDLQQEADKIQAEEAPAAPREITVEAGRATIPLPGPQESEFARLMITLLDSAMTKAGAEKNVEFFSERKTREIGGAVGFNHAGRDVVCCVKDMDQFKADIDVLTQRIHEAGPVFHERVQELLSMSAEAKKVEIPVRLRHQNPEDRRWGRREEKMSAKAVPQIKLRSGEEGGFDYSLTLKGMPVDVVSALLQRTSLAVTAQQQTKPVMNDAREKAFGGPGLVEMTIPVKENAAQAFNDFIQNYAQQRHY